MFALQNRGELPFAVELEVENFMSRLRKLWLAEHNEDGTHNGDIVSLVGHTHDASAIISGSFNKTRQNAQTAYKDEANIFTQNQRINAGLSVNMAPGATGTLSLSDGIFERSRTTKMGEWISVPHSGTHYTVANGTETWTVDLADQVSRKYTLVGKTMTYSLRIDDSTLAGAADDTTTLAIALPSGFTVGGAANVTYTGFHYYRNGGAWDVGFCHAVSGETRVQVFKRTLNAFTREANAFICRLSITFEIQ